jgi:hypothetical protein
VAALAWNSAKAAGKIPSDPAKCKRFSSNLFSYAETAAALANPVLVKQLAGTDGLSKADPEKLLTERFKSSFGYLPNLKKYVGDDSYLDSAKSSLTWQYNASYCMVNIALDQVLAAQQKTKAELQAKVDSNQRIISMCQNILKY